MIRWSVLTKTGVGSEEPSKSAARKGATDQMGSWKEYSVVKTLDEAVQKLSESIEPVKIIAGGTDLLLEIQQGHQPVVHTLIDVNNIDEMKCMEVRGERLFIGAAVAVSKITNSPLVKQHALAVSEATGLIGGPQVRNAATIGGNVAHALPAADGMISLVALDTKAVIYRNKKFVEVPILSLFKGPGQSTLEKNEILVGFYLNLKQPGEGSAFDRVMRPQGVALPILNNAIWLKRIDNMIEDIRIVFGPSGPVPTRAEKVEEVLKGNSLEQSVINLAKKTLRESVKFRTSKMRATAAYRYELADLLLERVLKKAWARTEEV